MSGAHARPRSSVRPHRQLGEVCNLKQFGRRPREYHPPMENRRGKQLDVREHQNVDRRRSYAEFLERLTQGVQHDSSAAGGFKRPRPTHRLSSHHRRDEAILLRSAAPQPETRALRRHTLERLAPHRMTLLTLAALGWLLAAIAMAALWAWQRFPAGNRILLATMAPERDVLPAGSGSYPGSVLLDVGWTALVAGLAIFDANAGGGAWARRSAIAWMMGSWGARLVVQRLYAPRPFGMPDRARRRANGTAALLPGIPGDSGVRLLLLAAGVDRVGQPRPEPFEPRARRLWPLDGRLCRRNDRGPSAAAIYLESGESRARCRAGLWRYSNNATAVFEGIIWTAYALFAFASPLGVIAFACPAVMVYGLATRPATASQP